MTEIEILKAELAKKDSEITDIKSRLKEVYAMDASTNNQELVTLKTNISNALSPLYTDSVAMLEEDLNADNFEFLKATCVNIFKVLKRHGIKF